MFSEVRSALKSRQARKRAFAVLGAGSLLLLVVLFFCYREDLLVTAVCGGRIRSAGLLLKLGASPKGEGAGAMSCAVRMCSLDFARILLQNGADARAKDPTRGMPPLHVLMAEGPFFRGDCLDVGRKIGDLLIAHGADPRAIVPYGGTVLHYVTTPAAVEYLMSKGADPNAHSRGSQGHPIHFLVAHADALRALLRSGADVNARDENGLSALHYAAMKRIEEREADLAHDIAAAEILLKHGANPNITDKLGRTPLDHAIESEFSTVAKLLRAHGGRESDPSMLAENEREKIDAERGKKEQSFFRRPVDTLSVPRPCSFNLGSDGMAVTDNGWHWGVRRGTVGVVKVRCDRPGYLHYAVLKVGSPVPTRINLSVAAGRGTFEIPFDEPWRHAQIAWYHTDKPVDDLRAAIKTGKARGVDSRDLDVIPLVGEQTQQDREGASQ